MRVDASAGTAIARLAARRAIRSGIGWGLVFAVSLASSAAAYASSFPSRTSRLRLARTLGTNRGLAAVLGPARRLDTVAGFTAWRTTVVLSVIGAVWGLLLATRLLRGEEDAGRWEILLAGATTRRRAAIQVAVGLATGWLALWAVAAAGIVAAGRSADVSFSASSAVFLATAVSVAAAVFLFVGALTSQVASTRHDANMLGAAAIGAAYMIRVVPDSSTRFQWMRWLSPIGWAEELHALTGSRPAVLLVPMAAVAVLGFASITIAGRRDLGAGALPDADSAAPRVGLLGSAGGLTVRLTRGVAVGWIGGLCIAGLAFGLVAQSAADAVSGSQTIEDAISRLGGRAAGAASYLGLTFLMAATLVAVSAATLIAATREQEADGYLDNLLVRPLSRASWFAWRMGTAAVLVVAAGVAAGLAAWAGAASQGTGIKAGDLVAAGFNISTPALFVLGVGALLLGVRPRWAAGTAYAVIVWSFLVELLGSVVVTNTYVLDTSLLRHIAPAPAAAVDWAQAGGLVGIGLAAALIGLVGFSRRDLAGA